MTERQYFASVVAIARFENRYIEEWINYNLLIGFQHIYLYDNAEEGEANLDFLIPKYSQTVTVIKIPGRYMQGAAYQHFINNYRRATKWAAFIDTDEFIVLKKDRLLRNFLDKYGHLKSIALSWLSFGHSGHVKRPQGLIVDNFTWRFPVCLSEVKTLCLCEDLERIHSIHNIDGNARLINGANLNGNGKVLHSQGTYYSPELDLTNIACINHYFTRSIEDLELKMSRGSAAGTVRGRRDFNWYLDRPNGFNWTLDLDAPNLIRSLIEGDTSDKTDYYRRNIAQYPWRIPAPLDFDPFWYESFYPDLVGCNLSAAELLEHFCCIGAHQGRYWNRARWEGSFFTPSRYLEANPALAKAGVTQHLAHYHYLVAGQIEGRKPFAVGYQDAQV